MSYLTKLHNKKFKVTMKHVAKLARFYNKTNIEMFNAILAGHFREELEQMV